MTEQSIVCQRTFTFQTNNGVVRSFHPGEAIEDLATQEWALNSVVKDDAGEPVEDQDGNQIPYAIIKTVKVETVPVETADVDQLSIASTGAGSAYDTMVEIDAGQDASQGDSNDENEDEGED